MTNFDNKEQATLTMNLAIGRIFLLGSRPFQEGDIEQYENAKWACMEAAEYLGLSTKGYEVSYAHDYYKIHHD